MESDSPASFNKDGTPNSQSDNNTPSSAKLAVISSLIAALASGGAIYLWQREAHTQELSSLQERVEELETRPQALPSPAQVVQSNPSPTAAAEPARNSTKTFDGHGLTFNYPNKYTIVEEAYRAMGGSPVAYMDFIVIDQSIQNARPVEVRVSSGGQYTKETLDQIIESRRKDTGYPIQDKDITLKSGIKAKQWDETHLGTHSHTIFLKDSGDGQSLYEVTASPTLYDTDEIKKERTELYGQILDSIKLK